MRKTYIPERAGPGAPFATAPAHVRLKIAWPSWPSILRPCVSVTCLFPWILLALVSLDLKYKMMVSGGFTVAARSLGRNVTGDGGFTFWERLSFFRMDMLIAVIGGVALNLLASYLPKRWRLRVVTGLSAVFAMALYAQLRALQEVGQFITLRMFLVAISWGLREPGAYAVYLGRHLFIYMGGLILLGLGLWWFFRQNWARIRVFARGTGRKFREAGVESGLLMLLLCLTTIPWVPQITATPYHRSIFLSAMNAYWRDDGIETGEFAGLSMPQLLHSYRTLTNAPDLKRDPAYWSKAKGSNVLYFVLETTPAMFLGADEPLDDLPNIRKLREHSLVAQQHHTTFPRTHEAVFSLLSSWYPSGVGRSFEEEHPGLKIPGIMRILSGLGYRTAIYSPMHRLNSLESPMYESVGVQAQFYPADSLAPSAQSTELQAPWQKMRVTRDRGTLDLLEQDLDQSLSKGQKFAAVFLPQISHFPYPDVPGVSDEQDLQKRSRAILKIEDAWLGEVLQLLDRYQQLDNTVIVIAGDHGLRDAEEDPKFVGGMIGEAAFHVPLIISSGRALDHTVKIPWITSHIDVAPTVLDLLGADKGREFEQGTAIWNPQLNNRTTYFFANELFGADGFYTKGQFYMWNRISDAVYSRGDLHFASSDVVRSSGEMHQTVEDSLNRIAGFQQVQTAQFGDSSSFRNHIFDRASNRPVVHLSELLWPWFLDATTKTFRFASALFRLLPIRWAYMRGFVPERPH
jgi:arylsulfatase A-like enzyme